MKRNQLTKQHLFARSVISIMSVLFCFPIAFTFLGSITSPEEINALYTNSFSAVYGSLPGMLLPRAFSWRQYYEVLLGNPAYMISFWNSVLLSTECTLVSVSVAILLGYVLTVTRFPMRKAAIRLIAVLMLLPWQALMLPEYLLSKWMGTYNTRAALIIAQGLSAFGVFLIYQFMRSVPDELIDAASMDTNSNIKVLLRIVCPMIRPGIIACMVLSFAESWNMIEQPLTLIENAALYPLSMMISDINASHIEIAFACCTVYMLPVVILGGLFGDKAAEGISGIGGGTIYE